MATHTQLPIYKASYDLLDVVTDLTKNMQRDWHQGQWNDATGTHLSECGWTPTHWMPLPKPPAQGEEK